MLKILSFSFLMAAAPVLGMSGPTYNVSYQEISYFKGMEKVVAQHIKTAFGPKGTGDVARKKSLNYLFNLKNKIAGCHNPQWDAYYQNILNNAKTAGGKKVDWDFAYKTTYLNLRQKLNNIKPQAPYIPQQFQQKQPATLPIHQLQQQFQQLQITQQNQQFAQQNKFIEQKPSVVQNIQSYESAATFPYIEKNGKIYVLLLKDKKDGQYALPGGLVDQTDQSPAHTAARETFEETENLKINPQTLTAFYQLCGADKQGKMHSNITYFTHINDGISLNDMVTAMKNALQKNGHGEKNGAVFVDLEQLIAAAKKGHGTQVNILRGYEVVGGQVQKLPDNSTVNVRGVILKGLGMNKAHPTFLPFF